MDATDNTNWQPPEHGMRAVEIKLFVAPNVTAETKKAKNEKKCKQENDIKQQWEKRRVRKKERFHLD